MGKGDHAGYQHFLLFPQCFKKTFIPKVIKSGLGCKCLIFSQTNEILNWIKLNTDADEVCLSLTWHFRHQHGVNRTNYYNS